MSISPITEYLYIGSIPGPKDVTKLLGWNVRLIINMIYHVPEKIFSQAPFHTITLSTSDLFFLPIPMHKLWKGVKAALPVMNGKDSVLVYCHQGRHRSVAMAACILIADGLSADRAMQMIAEKRPIADPYTWHIQRRIREFETEWKNNNPGPNSSEHFI